MKTIFLHLIHSTGCHSPRPLLLNICCEKFSLFSKICMLQYISKALIIININNYENSEIPLAVSKCLLLAELFCP